ncbi:MAG TPA: thioesterase family protein [Acidimicrobiales bacterium]|nr:thioesterase family protein [Acidimicrobiales bacterium]
MNIQPADAELLGIEFDDHLRSRFELTPPLSRHDGALYGGTAIAVATVAMEAASDRPPLWVTTQFVSQAALGDVIECETEVLASGKRVAQLRVTAYLRGAIVFTALGSTGIPRAGGLSGQFDTMPSVTSPANSRELVLGHGGAERTSFRRSIDYLEAARGEDHAPDPAQMLLWARVTAPGPITPAAIGFVADMVPAAIARGAGKLGAGISLDNSMRFGPRSDSEWVLLEMRGHVASEGFGHGSVRVWTPDGVLVAVGGQTANMIFAFDQDGPVPPSLQRFGRDANE